MTDRSSPLILSPEEEYRLTVSLEKELPLIDRIQGETPLVKHRIRLSNPKPIKQQRYRTQNPRMQYTQSSPIRADPIEVADEEGRTLETSSSPLPGGSSSASSSSNDQGTVAAPWLGERNSGRQGIPIRVTERELSSSRRPLFP